MLGIPTRSDAMELDPNYMLAVEQENIAQALDFRNALSTIHAHNHVVEAYSDAGLQFPRVRDVEDLNLRRYPRKVDQLLDPEWVKARFLERTRRFETNLDIASFVLNRETEVVVSGPNSAPTPELSSDVVAEQHRGEPVFEANKIVGWKGNDRTSWLYRFNPYMLTTDILGKFEATLTGLPQRRQTRLASIAAMMQAAKGVVDSREFNLASDTLQSAVRIARSPYSMERDETHPVHQLRLQNQAAGVLSDIQLRFDEVYFMAGADKGHLVPADSVLDTEGRMHWRNLQNRITLRGHVRDATRRKGTVAINGVVYQPIALGQVSEGYKANGQSYQEFADLFGKPIVQGDGEVIMPDEWAADEVRLIDGHLAGSHEDTNAILDRYNLDASSGHPSDDKARDLLGYIAPKNSLLTV